MNVGDIMTADVITVGPETSVHKAAQLMSDHGVSGLPVVDAEGRVLGLVTEGDLILRQASRAAPWWRRFFAEPETLAREYQKAAGTTVGEVMTRDVVSVSPAIDIGAAARMLHEGGFRRLPVVRDGPLVGILSRGDLVKALAATPVTLTSASDDELVAAMRERMRAEPWSFQIDGVERAERVNEILARRCRRGLREQGRVATRAQAPDQPGRAG